MKKDSIWPSAEKQAHDEQYSPERPQLEESVYSNLEERTIKIGRINNLAIVKEVDFGVYLDGGPDGEILLPIRYVPKEYKLGEYIDVFIYFDSEDRMIATTEKPLAMVGHFAFLKVVDTNRVGAFLEWGLPKNLLVPFSEQKPRMQKGQSYLVYIYLDSQTFRIVASAKLDKFMKPVPSTWKPGRTVNLIIHSITHLGYKTVVEKTCWGLLYKNEVFEELKVGQEIPAYINRIRLRDKIDLTLQKSGYEKIDPISAEVLKKIKENGGSIEMTDKSSPQLIYDTFGISKKTFKKALGSLYKRRLILISRRGIKLNR